MLPKRDVSFQIYPVIKFLIACHYRYSMYPPNDLDKGCLFSRCTSMMHRESTDFQGT